MPLETKFVEGTGCQQTVTFCTDCEGRRRPHQVEKVDTGPAPNWGGAPSHIRRCTGCGFSDGPWVSADDVGEGTDHLHDRRLT